MKVEVASDIPNEVMKIIKNGVSSESSLGDLTYKKEEKESDKNKDKNTLDEIIHSSIISSQVQTISKSNDNVERATEELFQCMICIDDVPLCETVPLSCSHRICANCTQEYIKSQILGYGRVEISCPEAKCTTKLHNDIIQKYTDTETYLKFERFSLKKYLRNQKDCHFCPDPNCDYAVIIKRKKILGVKKSCAKDDTKIDCQRPTCNTSFCYLCGEKWHPGTTCEQNKTLLKISGGELIQQEHTKPCPKCNVPIFKLQDGTCNHMICSSCGVHFCWLCMKEINEMHFFSPSGCSFHADEPMTLSKKILLQTTLFFTAPIIISLAAVVSFPAIAISIPWKTAKNISKWSSKDKRMMGYVFLLPATALLSPIAAAGVVAIGVPTLVVTAYGIIPGYLIHEAIKNNRIQKEKKKALLLQQEQQQETSQERYTLE